MQGHTWKDMQQADTVMKMPWTLLRALGLYDVKKEKRTGDNQDSSWVWGYDYVTNVYMRIANDVDFFGPAKLMDLLEDNNGGLPFLPCWLYPKLQPPFMMMDEEENNVVEMDENEIFERQRENNNNDDDDGEDDDDEEEDDESAVWFNYLESTLQHIYITHVRIVLSSIVLYVLARSILCPPTITTPGGAHTSEGCTDGTLVRLIIMSTMVYGLWLVGRSHVDSTQWAQAIRGNHIFGNVMDNELDFADIQSSGWTTLPTRNDVLLEHRIGGSHYMGLFRDWISRGHRGNARFHELISSTVPSTAAAIATTTTTTSDGDSAKAMATTTTTLFHLSPPVKSALVSFIFKTVTLDYHGRFLQQGALGDWYLIPREKAYSVIAKALARAHIPILSHLIRDVVKPMITEWRYGIYRHTVMAYKYAVPSLQMLQERLYAAQSIIGVSMTLENNNNNNNNRPGSSLSCSSLRTHPVSRRTYVSSDGATLLHNYPVVGSGAVNKDASRGPRLLWKRSLLLLLLRDIPHQEGRKAVVAQSESEMDLKIQNLVPVESSIASNLIIPLSSSSSTSTMEPYTGAWLRTGSLVEFTTTTTEQPLEGYWFVGEIVHISATGEYMVWHPLDGLMEYNSNNVIVFDPNNWINNNNVTVEVLFVSPQWQNEEARRQLQIVHT